MVSLNSQESYLFIYSENPSFFCCFKAFFSLFFVIFFRSWYPLLWRCVARRVALMKFSCIVFDNYIALKQQHTIITIKKKNNKKRRSLRRYVSEKWLKWMREAKWRRKKSVILETVSNYTLKWWRGRNKQKNTNLEATTTTKAYFFTTNLLPHMHSFTFHINLNASR